MQRRGCGWSLVVASVFATAALAQARPKAGAPFGIAVPVADGKPARAHGYTPGHYLDQGRYPLVVWIGDREVTGAAAIRALPLPVLDRKQMIVVAPELASVDYEPRGHERLQALVLATIEAARAAWSIDERRVLLVGVGRGASRAFAIARDVPDRFVAVAGLAPDDAWMPVPARLAKVPALLVTAGGKARATADAVKGAFGTSLPITISERPEVQKGGGAMVVQPLLEWLLGCTLPPPADDKDRIVGRTVAASGSKNRVIAITGEFDTVEDVLAKLEIPHLKMTWLEFRDFDLTESDVLLINCSTGEAYGQVRAAVNKKLREFVVKGGYLFATDWSLRWPVSEVFGDHIGDVDPGTPDMMVDVRPAAAAHQHELLQNVFPLSAPLPRWQIDAASFLIDPKKRERLEVLLESDELAAAYKGNGALGVCFRVGAYGGMVLDVVSHFAHQGDGTPTTPMYQLIVNFINAAKKHRQTRR